MINAWLWGGKENDCLPSEAIRAPLSVRGGGELSLFYQGGINCSCIIIF